MLDGVRWGGVKQGGENSGDLSVLHRAEGRAGVAMGAGEQGREKMGDLWVPDRWGGMWVWGVMGAG